MLTSVETQAQATRSIVEVLPPEIARKRILGAKPAAAFIGLSVSEFRRRARIGEVPGPVKLSEHRIGWRLGDLCDWLDTRPAA